MPMSTELMFGLAPQRANSLATKSDASLASLIVADRLPRQGLPTISKLGAARMFHSHGCKIVAVQDASGAILNRSGLDPVRLNGPVERSGGVAHDPVECPGAGCIGTRAVGGDLLCVGSAVGQQAISTVAASVAVCDRGQ